MDPSKAEDRVVSRSFRDREASARRLSLYPEPPEPNEGDLMRYYGRLWILMLLSVSLFLAGCSTTIHETKSAGTNEGNVTELKFTGSKMKVVHDF